MEQITETFKLKVQNTVENEVEISLPHYRMASCFAFKIFSDDKCICVDFTSSPATGVHHVGLAYHLPETKDCTEAEFYEKYSEVKYNLMKIIEGI